jgi:hypothetical protein
MDENKKPSDYLYYLEKRNNRWVSCDLDGKEIDSADDGIAGLFLLHKRLKERGLKQVSHP